MLVVLTGDIIESQKGEVSDWIQSLKQVLSKYGQTPKDWEIYRGDSFQIKTEPQKALELIFKIKSSVKKSSLHDVRIGIGIGEESYKGNKITESNGAAYVNSGKAFDGLKKETLRIKSNNSEFDERINLMFDMIGLTINHWTPVIAEAMCIFIENPEITQKQIAEILGKSQSTVSDALNRGGYKEIQALNNYYKNQIKKL